MLHSNEFFCRWHVSHVLCSPPGCNITRVWFELCSWHNRLYEITFEMKLCQWLCWKNRLKNNCKCASSGVVILRLKKPLWSCPWTRFPDFKEILDLTRVVILITFRDLLFTLNRCFTMGLIPWYLNEFQNLDCALCLFKLSQANVEFLQPFFHFATLHIWEDRTSTDKT